MSDIIDYSRIRQPKVKKFIRSRGLDQAEGFNQMQSVGFIESADGTYHTHHCNFFVNKDLNTVWNAYVSIHPRDAWHGSMVSFGLQYNRHTGMVNYLEDPHSGLSPGQILILNLRIFSGLVNIAVAHEVMEVCSKDRLIKLSYMEGGASEGSQWIRFKECKDGSTEISHLTRYKSNSAFRDKQLYPRLHTRAISEFHNSVKRKFEST